MRKFIAAFLLLFLVSGAAATTIQQETVNVDLQDSHVSVDVWVEELTSSSFTYITSYPIGDVEASSPQGNITCSANALQVGSEIECDPPSRSFNVSLDFRGFGLTSIQQDTRIFRYTQSINRPTNSYTLRVVLPPGAGLLDGSNVSTPVVNPPAETGSNGRRIFVEWNANPRLGETLQFQVLYEELFRPLDYARYVAAGLLVLLFAVFSYFGYRRVNREDIETVYDRLSQDEIDVLELLRSNGGEMLQKDIVAESDYSKAKISGVVSRLVDEEVVVKEKEGRSNRLSISRKYIG